MTGAVSFDIFLLGLKDPSPAARDGFFETMEGITGRPRAEHEAALGRTERPLFSALPRERALEVVNQLEAVGARLEIRPGSAPAQPPTPEPAVLELQQETPTRDCPSCGFASPVDQPDCQRCGLVFAKWERESLQRMRRERLLEEALTKAHQIREEWVDRAKRHLERNPMPAGATVPFKDALLMDELPFVRLDSDQGPILLTSRRLLWASPQGLCSIPWEIISDATLKSALVQIKARLKLQVSLHAPLMLATGPAKSLTWSLFKDAQVHKDAIMDWSFSRGFLCGACGAAEMEYRSQRSTIHFRCMRCATDHEVDLNQGVAIPDLRE